MVGFGVGPVGGKVRSNGINLSIERLNLEINLFKVAVNFLTHGLDLGME